jgi:hypothetical protein
MKEDAYESVKLAVVGDKQAGPPNEKPRAGQTGSVLMGGNPELSAQQMENSELPLRERIRRNNLSRQPTEQTVSGGRESAAGFAFGREKRPRKPREIPERGGWRKLCVASSKRWAGIAWNRRDDSNSFQHS